jgi:hypothetical protein
MKVFQMTQEVKETLMSAKGISLQIKRQRHSPDWQKTELVIHIDTQRVAEWRNENMVKTMSMVFDDLTEKWDGLQYTSWGLTLTSAKDFCGADPAIEIITLSLTQSTTHFNTYTRRLIRDLCSLAAQS